MRHYTVPITPVLKYISVVANDLLHHLCNHRSYEWYSFVERPMYRRCDASLGGLFHSVIGRTYFSLVVRDYNMSAGGLFRCVLEGFLWFGNNDHLWGIRFRDIYAIGINITCTSLKSLECWGANEFAFSTVGHIAFRKWCDFFESAGSNLCSGTTSSKTPGWNLSRPNITALRILGSCFKIASRGPGFVWHKALEFYRRYATFAYSLPFLPSTIITRQD